MRFDLYIIFLSNFMFSHRRPCSINLYASGCIGFASEPIVSSIMTMNLPLYIFAYSSFRIAVLAFPMWSGPDGNGASLITTSPFLAFGSFLSPTLTSRFDILCSSFLKISFCSPGASLTTSLIISWIVGIMSLISDFSSPSAKSAAMIAFWSGLPLCLIAFSRAWAFITSFGISVMYMYGVRGSFKCYQPMGPRFDSVGLLMSSFFSRSSIRCSSL